MAGEKQTALADWARNDEKGLGAVIHAKTISKPDAALNMDRNIYFVLLKRFKSPSHTLLHNHTCPDWGSVLPNLGWIPSKGLASINRYLGTNLILF